jgi:hypothetical protein
MTMGRVYRFSISKMWDPVTPPCFARLVIRDPNLLDRLVNEIVGLKEQTPTNIFLSAPILTPPEAA